MTKLDKIIKDVFMRAYYCGVGATILKKEGALSKPLLEFEVSRVKSQLLDYFESLVPEEIEVDYELFNKDFKEGYFVCRIHSLEALEKERK